MRRQRSLFKHKYLVRVVQGESIEHYTFPTKIAAQHFAKQMNQLGKDVEITKGE